MERRLTGSKAAGERGTAPESSTGWRNLSHSWVPGGTHPSTRSAATIPSANDRAVRLIVETTAHPPGATSCESCDTNSRTSLTCSTTCAQRDERRPNVSHALSSDTPLRVGERETGPRLQRDDAVEGLSFGDQLLGKDGPVRRARRDSLVQPRVRLCDAYALLDGVNARDMRAHARQRLNPATGGTFIR